MSDRVLDPVQAFVARVDRSIGTSTRHYSCRLPCTYGGTKSKEKLLFHVHRRAYVPRALSRTLQPPLCFCPLDTGGEEKPAPIERTD